LLRIIIRNGIERLLASQARAEVEEEMKQQTSVYQRDRLEFIKNPSVLEFLGLPAGHGFASKYMPYLPTEKELMVVIHVKE